MSFQVERSWATEPLFFEAPHPPNTKPRGYQHAAVEYALARSNCLVGDAPGVGKTAEAILLSNAIGARRTLVICPASLRLNWEREIWRWSTVPNVRTYPTLSSRDGVSPQAHYQIISYDLLRNRAILDALMSLRWDHLILDEAHYIKDPRGNKRVIPICAPDLLPSVVGRTTMLSGTIMPNQPIECLGIDTLVLTNEGWMPVIEVQRNHYLWDGKEWVKHGGVLNQGPRQTIELAGVTMTPDHAILGGKEWFSAAEVAQSESILSHVLETALGSLPLPIWKEAPRAGSSKFGLGAIAARRLMQLQRAISGAARMVAGLAGRKKVPVGTRILAPTRSIEPVSYRVSQTSSSAELTNLKNVYDIANAGPRQCFTVWTNRGPMIVHNCYNAVRLLDWDAIDRMSLERFRDHYYEEGSGFVTGRYQKKLENGDTVWTYGPHWSTRVRNKPTNLDELRERLRSRVMIRRLKQHVLPQLPKRVWHPFPLAPTKAMREALKHPGWVQAERMYELDPDAFNTGVPIDGAISTARRLLGEAKAPEVLDYIKELLREGVEKVVVGAWHHSVLEILREGLTPYGLVYMDGRTSDRAKQAAVDAFQDDPEMRVILGQTKVLGLGWTLTAAQDVVLAEPDWVPGNNDQVLDRVHRYGAEGGSVLGHLPIVANTMDERVLGTAIEKDVHINRAMDGDGP